MTIARCKNICCCTLLSKIFSEIVPSQKVREKIIRGDRIPQPSLEETITISGHFLIPDFPPLCSRQKTWWEIHGLANLYHSFEYKYNRLKYIEFVKKSTDD